MYEKKEGLNMHLSKLILRDATRILEWGHDGPVVERLGANVGTKTLADCDS